MSDWERELSDAFLEDVEDVEALVNGLGAPEVRPEGGLRAALLAAATPSGRFARFKQTVARLLDVDETRAETTLDRIDQPDAWYQSALPGMELVDIDGGPAVKEAIVGWVRLGAGTQFPEHTHGGEENVMVIQGSLQDDLTGQIFRPGDVAKMPAGSTHSFTVRPGPDLVYLLVVQKGVTIAGQFYAYDDPRV